MGSGNWVIDNLTNALSTWNDKLAEIWQLISISPQNFRGGGIWSIIIDINGTLKAIGYALLVLFFVIGIVKTTTNFSQIKRPEHALKLFLRFALAKGVVGYGMDLMLAIFKISQGIISNISGGVNTFISSGIELPDEVKSKILETGFGDSIPLWIVTLLGSLFITVLAFILIMTVYSRFFSLYMYTAIAPIPLSTFAGEGTSRIGKQFLILVPVKLIDINLKV